MSTLLPLVRAFPYFLWLQFLKKMTTERREKHRMLFPDILPVLNSRPGDIGDRFVGAVDGRGQVVSGRGHAEDTSAGCGVILFN